MSTGSSPSKARRGGWTLDYGQPEDVIAGARNAFFVMVGVLVILWAIQIVNWADSYRLDQTYGITPHNVADLPYLLTAPFLHLSWTHIEGNSGPLFIFGFLAAFRGIRKFAAVTLMVVLTSGLAAWLFSNAIGVGASGVVFGYFGYIMVRGLFDRHGIDVVIGAVMALCFAYQFSVLLPQQGIGWQDHIGGLAGGIVAGWLLRDRRRARAMSAARRVAGPATSGPGHVGVPGTAIAPIATGGLSPSTRPMEKPGKRKAAKPGGKGSTVDPANPRADLYKELDDLGL